MGWLIYLGIAAVMAFGIWQLGSEAEQAKKKAVQELEAAFSPLIPCPACKKPVSESAPACPQCGLPLTAEVVETQKRNESERVEAEQKAAAQFGLGCGVIILFVLGLFISAMWSSNAGIPSSPQHLDTTDEHLRTLPSLRGYTESEKDEIIKQAKKFEAVTSELERQRGS
jgi:hypothetical protein